MHLWFNVRRIIQSTSANNDEVRTLLRLAKYMNTTTSRAKASMHMAATISKAEMVTEIASHCDGLFGHGNYIYTNCTSSEHMAIKLKSFLRMIG